MSRSCAHAHLDGPAHARLGFDLDGVNPVQVKRQVFPDRRYGGIRSLVAPDGVDRAFSAGRNAEISALALVGTIRLVHGPLQLRHIDVLARDVLHRGIGRFLQGQGLAGIGDAVAVHGDRDPAVRRRDGDRMIRPRNLDWLAVHAVKAMRSQSLEPPSTWMVSPVIQRASSEAKKATAGATSSGWATRFSACIPSVPSRPASVLVKFDMSVSTTPGATALTRMPWG